MTILATDLLSAKLPQGPQGIQGIQGLQGPPLTWSVKTSNYTAVNGDAIVGNTSGGSFNITLPAAPVAGTMIAIADGNDWSVNNLTVLRNGSTIEGIADNLILDVKDVRVDLVYTGTTWQVFANIGPPGLQGTQGIQGIQGRQGISGSQGLQGLTGAGTQGVQGIQGILGSTIGFSYQFSTSTTASDPGNGFFRFNAGNTEMYISGTDADGVIRSGALALMDDTPGTDRGTFFITEIRGGTPGPISVTVTGDIVSNGTWLTVPINIKTGTNPANNEFRRIAGVRNGAQGVQGFQGTQGLQGVTGGQGIQGVTGAQGITGAQGLQGLTGTGTQGITGAQGIQGLTGQGIQGLQGIQGRQGVQGIQGLSGAQGITGAQGLTGQGIQGLQGVTGQQGIQGLTGAGTQGIQGLTGQGIQGLQGITGQQGIQGLTGQGLQGLQGIQGRQGLTGVGSQGVQGLQGLTGQGIQGLQGITGQQGIQGLTGAGTQGLQGITGAGTQGIQGLTGVQGITGAQGISGASGSVTITDDTTTNATRYVGFVSATSGTATTLNVSSTKLYFNPSTGTLNATIFNSLSDETLKTDLTKIDDALSLINKIQGFRFKWKDGGKDSIGVSAQEVEEVLPELVSSDEFKSVNYNGIIALLIEAVKELSKEIKNK